MIFRWFKRLRAKSEQAQARKDLERFAKTFGAHVCPICSHHRFGYAHGYETDPIPAPHEGCPEQAVKE